LSRTSLIFLCSIPLALPSLFFAFSDIVSGKTRVALKGEKSNFADILGYFSPHPSNPILGKFSFIQAYYGNTETYTYIGFGLTVLALIGFVKYRHREKSLYFWFIATVAFIILSLGEYPHFLGRKIPVPMPFKIFSYIPILDNVHASVRVRPVTLLCITVLASYGVRFLMDKKRAILCVLLALVLIEAVIIPYPVSPNKVPEVYDHIARDESADVVLEVPYFARDTYNYIGRPLTTEIQYYQTRHQKRLINGTVSRLGPDTIFLSLLKPADYSQPGLDADGSPPQVLND
jgi:hypothetical protein